MGFSWDVEDHLSGFYLWGYLGWFGWVLFCDVVEMEECVLNCNISISLCLLILFDINVTYCFASGSDDMCILWCSVVGITAI